MTSLFIIIVIILTIFLWPSNRVKARVQTTPFQEIRIIKIDPLYKVGDIIHEGYDVYTILEILPRNTVRQKVKAFIRAVKSYSLKIKRKVQLQLVKENEIPLATEVIGFMAAAFILISSLIAGIDVCMAAWVHKRVSLLNIRINLTSILIIASSFIMAYSYILILIIRHSRKIKQS